MSWARRNWSWIVATLIVAALVHGASVMLLPRVIMLRTMAVISKAGGLNAMTHAKRPTAAARGIVRPSPDLLYSTCVFDLNVAGGAVRVHASAMPDTYWSVSLFDAQTNNFFVLNDRQAKGGAADFLVIAPGAFIGGTKLPVVVAPTTRGLVLFRTLINDEKHVAQIDAARRHAACEPFRANP
jgi:uncharacterized membrane protein